MARNLFPGVCYICGHPVAPRTGHFERYSGPRGKAWRTKHANVPGNGRITCEMARQTPASKQEGRS